MRERVGLTQTALARLLGVTQPAVSAWERGVRKPSGRPACLVERLHHSLDGPVRSYADHRGRPVSLPARRWEPPISLRGDVELPTRLDWSPRSGSWNVDEPVRRAGLYAVVLDEGSPADVRIWIDPDHLVALWPDVPVSRHLRQPVADLVASLTAPSEQSDC